MPLLLKNPHSVLATLLARPEEVIEVYLPKTLSEGWDRVAEVARSKKIPIRAGSPPRPTSKDPGDSRLGSAGGLVKEKRPVSTEELFEDASKRSNGKGLWLALDQLQDPQNVGAIFRSAAFFGVEGILITQDRSAPLTATVYDVAAGGVEYIPFAVQPNLQRAFEVAKEKGLWILGTSEHAQESILSIPKDRPWLLVLGNEERGMRRLTSDSCDLLCQVPGSGKVTSLNVSVAAGILISRLTLE